MRILVCLALAAVLSPVPAWNQTSDSFDVASVRPTAHGGKDAQGFSWSSADITGPGHFAAENSSLDELIRFAYDLKEYQVYGPAWLNDKSECFDVLAKAPASTSEPEMRAMLQTLLIERFRLAAHRESRTLPVYDLIVGKKGARLKPADPAGQKGTSSGGGNMTSTRVTMADFAYALSRQLKCPVFDKTGIAGTFDINLHYSALYNTMDEDRASVAPSLFTAIQERAYRPLAKTRSGGGGGGCRSCRCPRARARRRVKRPMGRSRCW